MLRVAGEDLNVVITSALCEHQAYPSTSQPARTLGGAGGRLMFAEGQTDSPVLHGSVASYKHESLMESWAACPWRSFRRPLGPTRVLALSPSQPRLTPSTSPPWATHSRKGYLLARGVHHGSGQKFDGASAQGFLLPLSTEHLQFLLLLFA